jgi:hypothetical protein
MGGCCYIKYDGLVVEDFDSFNPDSPHYNVPPSFCTLDFAPTPVACLQISCIHDRVYVWTFLPLDLFMIAHLRGFVLCHLLLSDRRNRGSASSRNALVSICQHQQKMGISMIPFSISCGSNDLGFVWLGDASGARPRYAPEGSSDRTHCLAGLQ